MIASVLKIFFSACLFFIEGFAIYTLLDINFPLSRKKIIISCLCWILVSFVSYQPIYNFVFTIIMYLGLVLSYSYIFQLTLIKSVIATGITYLIMALGDLIGGLILSLFFRLNTLRDNNFLLIFGNLFVIIFILFFSFLPFYKKTIGSFVRRINYRDEKNIILFLVLTIVSLSIIDLQFTSTKIILSELLIILIPLVILFILLFLYIFEQSKFQTLNNQYEILFNHATSLESWLENDRLSYHEYKNQLAYIRSIVVEDEAIQYIDSILQESFDDFSSIDTQIVNIPNGGMKGVIFYKLIQAQKKGIQTCISISPKMKGLSIGDNVEIFKTVCRIFGIILDNAIEAASESLERKISLEMYYLDHKVIFVVMNTFNGKVDIMKSGEKGYTTKGKGHGNGLNFIKNIVSRNKKYVVKTYLVGKYYTQKVIINE